MVNISILYQDGIHCSLIVSNVLNLIGVRARVMVFNATFNDISVILRSVLLVEETGVP